MRNQPEPSTKFETGIHKSHKRYCTKKGWTFRLQSHQDSLLFIQHHLAMKGLSLLWQISQSHSPFPCTHCTPWLPTHFPAWSATATKHFTGTCQLQTQPLPNTSEYKSESGLASAFMMSTPFNATKPESGAPTSSSSAATSATCQSGTSHHLKFRWTATAQSLNYSKL